MPPDDRPPVNVVRFAFQTMVGIGTLLALLGVRASRDVAPAPAAARVALVLLGGRGRRAAVGRRARSAGWVTTEVGRQPWVVYDVMRTSEAVTGAGGIPVGYATLVVVYLALAVAVAWILRRLRARRSTSRPSRRRSSRLHGAR